MVERTPRKSIRKILRQEVNYGCPICGIPYLTWHHFDPPWNEEHHERPEGIIALCHNCHDKADAGRYTKEQLVYYKRNPIIKIDEISARYDYLRRNTVCLVGDCIGYRAKKTVLAINGESIIWFEQDENGYDQLNLLIRDYLGNIILKMENNDWTIFTENIFDIECPARGRSLKILSRDNYTNFEFKFDDLDEKEFFKLMSDIGYDRGVIEKILSHIREDNPDLIPIWTLKGKLSYIDMDLVIDDNGWRFDIDGAITNCTLRRCIAIGSGCLISIGDNTSDITKRNPASLLRQLQNRIDKSTYQRNEIKSRLKDIDIILAELQKSDSPNVVYKRIGSVFLISDSDKLIEEYKVKKEDADMHLKFIIQQEKRSNIRLRNAKEAIFRK